MNELAARIQAEINLRGWTKAELSRRSGASAATIGRVLSGTWDGTSVQTLRGIATALDWPFDPVTGQIEPPPLPEGSAFLRRAAIWLRGDPFESLSRDQLQLLMNAENAEQLADAFETIAAQIRESRPQLKAAAQKRRTSRG